MTRVLVLLAVVLRLVPHLPNFAPMGAASIFAGAKLRVRNVLLFTLFSAALTDYLLLYINPFSEKVFDFNAVHPISMMFHATTFFVWGSFMISGLLGLSLRGATNYKKVFMVSVISALQFYIVTNFGVWAMGAYSRDLSGLMQSYVMALPFLKWTLLSEIFYSMTFFALSDVANKAAVSDRKALTN